MLDTLSQLHARWWEDPALLKMFDVPMRSTGPMAEWPRSNGIVRLNEALSGPRGEGPWAFDVAYMIVTALSVEDRRRNERDLIAYYIDSLERLGVSDAPSATDA